ncbi:FAD-binding protein [Sphingomonas cannabina]|uniref:FAD-binding protein n=1 Tax=Sphingomonas cannabina TaxID=2899123 RepID=UPI001F3FEA7C|nr:FAD-binding protein [Sphingomonas cannabina]UIJ45246.1 FAD-binding protein [Sphingomonas cannabina]
MRPTNEDEVRDAIADAIRAGATLDIRGGGSKAAIGAARPEARILDLSGLSGVVDYDPAELVLTVRPGTPLVEVEALVAGRGQRLAFDPFDHGPLLGETSGAATIGGVVAAGVAGSLRLSGGAPRDHLLGLRAVSGRAETFVAGAKVVKNVTGYDLPKLAAGSWGRLFAITEMTLKVLPRPPIAATRAVEGLDPAAAVKVMAAAMGSPAEVGAAAYLPAGDGPSVTALRLLGFGPSVTARCRMIEQVLGEHGKVVALDGEKDAAWWDRLRVPFSKPLPFRGGVGGGAVPQATSPVDRPHPNPASGKQRPALFRSSRGDDRPDAPEGEGLVTETPLWRVNVPPSGGPSVAAALEPHGARWLFDWAGGLVWVAFDGDPALVRDAAAKAGGHAMLIRAPEAIRAAVPTLHPLAPGVAALEERVRRAFDPAGVFETGRF